MLSFPIAIIRAYKIKTLNDESRGHITVEIQKLTEILKEKKRNFERNVRG